MTYVIHSPLALKVGLARRNAGKIHGKLLRIAVHPHQIEAALLADDEQFLSVRLGVGLLNRSGPTVSCIGSALALLKKDVLSRRAQMF